MLFRHILVYPVLSLDRIEHCSIFTVIDTCYLKHDTYRSESSSITSSIDTLYCILIQTNGGNEVPRGRRITVVEVSQVPKLLL